MMDRIRNHLLEMSEESYKNFQCKLMPTVESEKVLGIRIPKLRAFAKQLVRENAWEDFVSELPHNYFEENNLHAFLIERIKDYGNCIAEINRFLPYVDNWATCDSLDPRCFKKHRVELLDEIKKWVASSHTYTVRFGIKMLMTYFLDDAFEPKYAETVANIKSDEYYINMMISWYFATALAKQWGSVIPYIEQRKLPAWIHAKTIQKSIESYRITPTQKEYLRTLK